ncbi:MAG TPA: flagellar type III secretion system pore protein FliP, partial [Armatimonadota bacterium]|nr:flagellar type III secretion system pore protein FliP [Armatimonadota bacterium]
MKRNLTLFVILIGVLCVSIAQADPIVPKLNIDVEAANGPQDVSVSLQILIVLTLLSLAPAMLIMLTSFTRIVIVLAFTRSALGTQQVPPNTVLIGLALFLTFFTMAPVWNQVNQTALKPYLDKQITFDQAIDRGSDPVRDFMFSQVREKDLALFVKLGHINRPRTEADIPTYVLIP